MREESKASYRALSYEIVPGPEWSNMLIEFPRGHFSSSRQAFCKEKIWLLLKPKIRGGRNVSEMVVNAVGLCLSSADSGFVRHAGRSMEVVPFLPASSLLFIYYMVQPCCPILV